MKRSNIIIKMVITLIVSILVGAILLVGIYSIPTDRIVKNIEESTSLFIQNENKVENWVGYLRYGVIDNSTDSIMINVSMCREHDSVVENALLNPRYNVDKELASQYGSSDISLFLDKNNITGTYDYSRYWHGYLLYLIPGLFFTNFGGVRMLITIVEFLLAMLLLYKVSKIDPIYMFAYGITILFINPITTALNLQNADIYILSLVFSNLILFFNDWLNKNNRYYLLFMLIGVSTSYFDFLTYPVVSFGIPMITTMLVNDDSLKESVKKVILFGLSWSFGYAGMWVGKWLLASMVTNQDAFAEAIKSFTLRSGNLDNGGKTVTFLDAMNLLNESINDIPMTCLLLLSVVVIVSYGTINKLKVKLNLNYIKEIVPFVIVGAIPFAWAFVVRNHFATHQFLEYRTMAVTVLSLLVIIIKSFNLKNNS